MVMIIITVHLIIIILGRPSSTALSTTTTMKANIESHIDPTWSQCIDLG